MIDDDDLHDVIADYEQWKTDRSTAEPDLTPTAFLEWRRASRAFERLQEVAALIAVVIRRLESVLTESENLDESDCADIAGAITTLRRVA